MKKVFMLFAAVALFAASAFAQVSRSAQQPALRANGMVKKAALRTYNAAKVSGNPIWNDTMSYCGNRDYYTGIGTNGSGIYWAIKLEAAALVGRNNIEAVEFFVCDADNGVGSYTMTIHQDSLQATPLLTQNVTTTTADALSWKSINLATPLAITQGHDLFICFYSATLPYPAAVVQPDNYDNGKLVSVDGSEWMLISEAGLDYTWMIRAISDTYTEQAPMISLEGPEGAVNGEPVTFTAVSTNSNSYSWTVDGAAVSETSNTLTYTFTTDGNHTVAVTGTNGAGSTTESITVEVYTCNAITEFPYTQDFETGIRCWNMVSMDPANDDLFGVHNDADFVYEGNYGFSFSSYNTAEDYNQWLISPELVLPNGENIVKFQYMAYSDGDAFRVMTSSTTNDPSSFTLLQDFSTVATDWTLAALTLPAGTKYVAIDYYGEYEYYLFIDNIVITSVEAPTVTIAGPASAEAGDEVTFTATATLAESFSWTVDGAAVSGTTNTLTTTFTTNGEHTVTVTATNSVGSNSATATINIFSCDPVTEFPWNADFETSGDFGCWKFIDADGDGYNWNTDYLRDFVDMMGNPDPQGYNGSNGLAGSASWDNGALTPDNWMVLPAMSLPAGSSLYLSWFAKGQDEEYASENYGVYISTTGRNVSDFTNEIFTEVTTGEWKGHNVDLSQYAGQTVNIAFRHYNCTDMFYLVIDDIAITSEMTGIDVAESNTVNIYPNPANNMVTVSAQGIEGTVNVQVVDLNGRVVMQQNGNAQGLTFDVSGLSKGVYFVRIANESVNTVSKLVVK